jgi:hypothetical protein
VGSDDGENIIVTVDTDDSYITMTTTQANYGTVLAGQTKAMTDAFAFDVAGNIPDLHTVIFNVEATDGTDTWESSFFLKGHAPNLSFLEVIVDDAQGNGNGRLDPGETANLLISVGNTGTADAYDVIGDLTKLQHHYRHYHSGRIFTRLYFRHCCIWRHRYTGHVQPHCWTDANTCSRS